mgnify:CR=1 FL=1
MSTDMFREMIKEGAEKQRRAAEKERLFSEFKAIDRESISNMSDIDLAGWQAQYPKESPQFIFAEQLWKYRLARKSAKFAALIATFAALIGAVVGYVIRGSEDPPKVKANEEIQKNIVPPVSNKAGKSPEGASHGQP